MVPDPSIPALLERIHAAGGSLTTNGRELRLRCLDGPLPRALLGEIQIRQKDIFRYFMGGEREGWLL